MQTIQFQSGAVQIDSPAGATIAPSADWDGTLSWPGRTPPIDPVRTTYKPIARFAIPPYQDVTEDFTVPILAFCKGGIKKITFWCEGNSVDVTTPSSVTDFNGRPFKAFTVRLSADSFPPHDGPLEVVANVVPVDALAQSRAITLSLFSNVLGQLPNDEVYVSLAGNDATGNGTQSSPYRTIWHARNSCPNGPAGATIYLEAGDYPYAEGSGGANTTIDRWLTIASEPGQKARITSSGSHAKGLRINNLKLSNVDLFQSGIQAKNADWPNASIWAEGMRFEGLGRQFASNPFGAWDLIFFTDCTFTSNDDGAVGAALCRNVFCDDLGSDAFSRSTAVINCDIRTIDSSGTSFHPDHWQHNSDGENLLFFGVRSVLSSAGQQVFLSGGSTFKDVAVVDCDLNGGGNSQFDDANINHAVLIGNRFDGTFLMRDDPDGTWFCENLLVKDNEFAGGFSAEPPFQHGVNGNVWEGNT